MPNGTFSNEGPDGSVTDDIVDVNLFGLTLGTILPDGGCLEVDVGLPRVVDINLRVRQGHRVL